MARVKSHKKSDSAEEWLDMQGFYRKPTARDGSCLFRAVSEQVFNSQVHHLPVRGACVRFMDRHRENYEEYIDGYFDHYLTNLQNPKEMAGQLEMNAMSLIYKKDFVVFQDEDKQQYQMTDNNFADKIFLYFVDGSHYDSVYPKIFLPNAAFCQSIIYDLLYKKVFNLGAEVDYAVEKMLHDKEYAKQRKDSATSQDGIYDKSSSPSPDFLFEPNEVETEEIDEDEGSQIRRALSRGFPPFPYKVAKALDPDIYRNVELDVWNEQRKEPQFEPGVKCLVRNGKDKAEVYHAHIQEIGQNKKFATVYIEELGEKGDLYRQTLAIESLEPLPTSIQRNQHWHLPVKAFKTSLGYYPKASNSKTTVVEYDQTKGKKKNKKKDGCFPAPVYPSRSQFDSQLVTYNNRGRASPPVVATNRSPSPRLKWTQSGQQNQNNFSRYRVKNGNGGRYGSQGNFHNSQPVIEQQQENVCKGSSEKEMFDFQDQDLAAFPALPVRKQISQPIISPNTTTSSSHVNTVWTRNGNNGNCNNNNISSIAHHASRQNPAMKPNIDKKSIQQELTLNCDPRKPTSPITITDPTPITTITTHSQIPPSFTPPSDTLSLSSPTLSQELNPQFAAPMGIPPQAISIINPQQTPPPSNYGYVPYPQMYPAPVIPFPDPPSQPINFNVGRSQDPNGSDLPMSDLPTLRFFYNLGHDYFRMSSYPPIPQQQPFVWNYGGPITYSPVNSFTPPPLIGPDAIETMDDPTCNGNGQCSISTRFGEQGDDRGEELLQQQQQQQQQIYDFELVTATTNHHQDNLIFTGYQTFDVGPPTSNVWQCPQESYNNNNINNNNFPRRHFRQPIPNRVNNLPPRFQRRNSSSNSNSSGSTVSSHHHRKDNKSRYEGQPLLVHDGFSDDSDRLLNFNPCNSPLTCTTNSTPDLPGCLASSSLGYYQSPGSPTSNPTLLASPPAIYYTNAPYVYHHQPPPPQPMPQHVSFLPAAV